MTIETKYNIGDEVWFMFKNKIYTSEVFAIEVSAYSKESRIYYDVAAGDVLCHYIESDLFPTKEELLKSL